MSTGNALMWFRADLRVDDNVALARASADARARNSAVIAVFVICPQQWQEHDWAGIRVDFVLRHLAELSAELAKINIPLLIAVVPRFADVSAILLKLAREHSCAGIYFNREYEINELRRDEQVARTFASAGLTATGFTDQVLVEPGLVCTAGGSGGFFTVFSPFKRALYKHIQESDGVRTVTRPAKQAATPIRPSPVPSTVDGFTSHVPNAAELWPAGERHASKRLATFAEKSIGRYKADRDSPSLDGTSKLSPYLAVGSISPRQCVLVALQANAGRWDAGDPGAVHWISEVAWREFYKHILIGFPRVCMGRAFKPETDALSWNDNQHHFATWCEGRTGYPIVDAAMRQLQATGWMHNRLRMIAAMFLTKDLFIDWRWGERYFMQHLIDGDLASNNGGWQWSASTGTDAAPYFRIFNPFSQSRTCDPQGTFIRKYVPELAELEGGEDGPIHEPSALPALLRASINYPDPVVDHAKARDHVLKAFKELAKS
ncbi:MAG: deoxyribodipyrimidine photo-lyase [Phycisphaerales bacterium]|nr:deoxyribodipyrimidine photo-lyase [Phycisphaerales bacterium]